MYFGWITVLAAIAVGLPYFLEYRDWTNWDKKDVLRIAPGPCKVVMEDGGSEDLMHIGNNKVLITQGFNFEFGPGQMSILDLNTNRAMRVNITNAPSREHFMAAPHGATSWKDPQTGQLYVYVLTHNAVEDRVEVFEVGPTLTLNWIRTITDPSFTFMNDMIAVGRDKFYITSIWRYRPKTHVTAETWARLPNGRIVYYDGRKGREVASGYFMANGINMSPDMKTIYMAECGYKTVHAFRRDESNNLHHLWAYDSETIVDNIDVDPDTGDLWIGCHPILWKALDYFGIFGATLPSQVTRINYQAARQHGVRGGGDLIVIRIKLRDNMVSEVEEIYSDDGSEIAGSTVGIYVDGKLVIGSVGTTTVVCDVPYLST